MINSRYLFSYNLMLLYKSGIDFLSQIYNSLHLCFKRFLNLYNLSLCLLYLLLQHQHFVLRFNDPHILALIDSVHALGEFLIAVLVIS